MSRAAAVDGGAVDEAGHLRELLARAETAVLPGRRAAPDELEAAHAQGGQLAVVRPHADGQALRMLRTERACVGAAGAAHKKCRLLDQNLLSGQFLTDRDKFFFKYS